MFSASPGSRLSAARTPRTHLIKLDPEDRRPSTPGWPVRTSQADPAMTSGDAHPGPRSHRSRPGGSCGRTTPVRERSEKAMGHSGSRTPRPGPALALSPIRGLERCGAHQPLRDGDRSGRSQGMDASRKGETPPCCGGPGGVYCKVRRVADAVSAPGSAGRSRRTRKTAPI